AVEWRLNGGSWTPASGTASWSFTASPLIAGANSVQVRARNAKGAYSSVASRVITREAASPVGPNTQGFVRRIEGGSLNGQPVSATEHTITVAPGESISGTVRVEVENIM